MKTLLLIILYLFLIVYHNGLAQENKADSTSNPITASPITRISRGEGNPVKPTSSQNYVLTLTPRTNISSTSQVDLSRLAKDIKRDITYYDGLGRSVQQTAIEFNTVGIYDLITHTTYDAYGRAEKQLLPYAETGFGGYRPNALSEQGDFTKTVYEASPLNRIKEVRGPGAWKNKPVRYEYGTNPVNTITRWAIQGNTPKAVGNYSANTLYKETVWDEDNQPTITYTDKLGRVVLTQTRSNNSTYLNTYRVYDAQGRLRFIIPPESKYYLYTQGTLNLNEWAKAHTYRFFYNSRGFLKEKSVPGVGSEYFIYDKRDRLILHQTGMLRQQSKWKFTRYDYLNRPVREGLYSDGGTYSQVIAKVPSNANTAFPTNNIETTQEWYYDDYSKLGDSRYQFRNRAGIFPWEARPRTGVKGKLTGSRKKVLGHDYNTIWLREAVYYDNRGKVIQTVADNYVGGQDIITNLYDHNLLTRVFHQNTSNESNGNFNTILETLYAYDERDRLTEVKQVVNRKFSTNGFTPFTTIAKYSYDKLGRLSKKDLNGLQGIEYAYNVWGWLTGIGNNSNQTQDDLFVMGLYYNEGIPEGLNGQKIRFNGNINGVIWKHDNNEYVQSYKYNYDQANRLTEAKYQQIKPGQNWSYAGNNYETQDIQYDKNGNITGLNRFDKNGSYLDKLTYTYNNRYGNRLSQVKDDGNKGAGFTERSTTSYEYDNGGNLTKNLDKEITKIEYNYLGLPKKITLQGGRAIRYFHTADGTKVQEMVMYPDGQTEVTTYASGFVYHRKKGESTGKLDFITHAEGRTKTATGSKWVQQYDLKDHLGNTRVTFNAEPTTTTFITSAETGEDGSIAQIEETLFENVAETRSTQAYHNSTLPSKQEPTPNKVALLNPVAGTVVGPAKSLKVSKGDSIHLEVMASYEEGSAQKPKGLESITMAVVSALTATPPAGLESSGMAGEAISEALAGSALLEDEGNHVPRAYLNYLLFDTSYQLLDKGFVQVSEAAKVSVGKQKKGLLGLFSSKRAREAAAAPSHATGEKLMLDIDNIPEEGILYVYTSNESNWDAPVMLDNMMVSQATTTIKVIDRQDYYAFGLTHQQPLSNQLKNRHLYQGQELSNDFGLGVYQFPLRSYDPTTGRWWQVDPYDQFDSPYVGMGNNPISGFDPDGGYTKFGAWVRALFTSGVSTSDIYKSGGEWGFNTQSGSTTTFNVGTFGEEGP